MSKNFYGREDELSELQEFIEMEGSGIQFLTGRRRVGKSSLLNQIKNKYRKRIIMYSGKDKSTIEKESYKLLNRIESFYGEILLTTALAKSQEIDIDKVFDRLISLLKKRNRNIILVLDEVQWLGNDHGNEFSTTLKEKWIELEETNKIKIIITGSSVRYFKDNLESSEGPLRGISDRDTIHLKPFTIGEVVNNYFNNYKLEEVFLIYMVTGGVPKYIDVISKMSKNKSFKYVFNKSFFVKGSYFLGEPIALLTVDLSRKKSTTAINILKK